MKSSTSHRFWQAYRQLPAPIRGEARKTYRLWVHNPRLPSLHFKKVGKVWSIRIGNTGYRALADLRGDAVYWFWIGTHDEYERILAGR
jgi:hypothetical protein